jgi:hypothetical protein
VSLHVAAARLSPAGLQPRRDYGKDAHVGAVRGLNRRLVDNIRTIRFVADNDGDVSPVYAPLHLAGCTSAPSSPAEGDIYYNSTANTLEVYDGSAWLTQGSVDANQDFSGTLDVTGAVVFDSTLNVVGRTTLPGNTMATTAGAGITAGSGTIYASGVLRTGTLVHTRILIDITGLNSSVTNDVIGVDGGAASCHLGQYTTAVSGTVFAGNMTCLEAPATGDADIDLWSADESTLAEDTQISAATGELQCVTAGGSWTVNESIAFSVLPGANDYFYLTSGGAGASATYTTGIFLIELFGLGA